MMELNEELKARALVFAAANKIASIGEIVTTNRPFRKEARPVMIVSVGARLIADYSKERGFFLDFEMAYAAHRIGKDGYSLERSPESGIYLANLTTRSGQFWQWRAATSIDAKSFNHVALAWTIEEIPWQQRRAKLCRPPKV